jgi:hypothetical protein
VVKVVSAYSVCIIAGGEAVNARVGRARMSLDLAQAVVAPTVPAIDGQRRKKDVKVNEGIARTMSAS